MNRHERRAAKAQGQYSVPLAVPQFATERCRRLIGHVLRAFGGIASTDAEHEDRALACFTVACSEIGAIKDLVQRNAILASLEPLARVLVAGSEAAEKQVAGFAAAAGVTRDEMIANAIDAGLGRRLDLDDPPSQH